MPARPSSRLRDQWWGRFGLVLLAGLLTTAATNPGATGPGTGGSQDASIRPDASVSITDVTAATARRPSVDGELSGVFSDLDRYWTAELPMLAGRTMTPLKGGFQAIDSSAPDNAAHRALCASVPSGMVGNAYYCPAGDGIIVDIGALVPVLLGRYGPGGLMASLAHEFGHAVQARIGPTEAERIADPSRYPSVLIEAGGDCYAGAFLAWVVSGAAPHLSLSETDLLTAVGPLIDFRDAVTTARDSATAHGLGLDRFAHLLAGYRSGPAACRALTTGTVSLTLDRAGVSTAESPPRFGTDAALLAAARSSLATFTRATRVVIPAAPSAPRAELAAARPFGQFALAAAVVRTVGATAFRSSSGTACFTGAWAASVFGQAPTGALGSWAGDPDEALDYLRSRPAASFRDIAAYTDGFVQGLSACRSEARR